jgi:hypothetical protein
MSGRKHQDEPKGKITKKTVKICRATTLSPWQKQIALKLGRTMGKESCLLLRYIYIN